MGLQYKSTLVKTTSKQTSRIILDSQIIITSSPNRWISIILRKSKFWSHQNGWYKLLIEGAFWQTNQNGTLDAQNETLDAMNKMPKFHQH